MEIPRVTAQERARESDMRRERERESDMSREKARERGKHNNHSPLPNTASFSLSLSLCSWALLGDVPGDVMEALFLYLHKAIIQAYADLPSPYTYVSGI